MMRCALVLCGCLLGARAALPCSIVIDASHPRATAQFPLQPVNEQLRGDRDPWLAWVRRQVGSK